MSTINGIAAALDRAFALFNVRASATEEEDRVVVPARAAAVLVRDVAAVDGSGSAHRVRSLLYSRGDGDVRLTVPDAVQLVRALEDVHRQKRRNDQIDRGQIPGPMSSSEVLRLARRHPGLFRRR